MAEPIEMRYGLGWAERIMLDGNPEVLRDIAMATNFWLSMRYNFFGSMIASDMLFDSRGWVFGVKLSDEDTAEIECLRSLQWQPILGPKLL